jgi:hypothetical protein
MLDSTTSKHAAVITGLLFLTLTGGCIMPSESDTNSQQSTIPNTTVTATTYSEAQLNGNITIQRSYTHPDATTTYRHTTQPNLTVTSAREITPSEYESVTGTSINSSFWETTDGALVVVEIADTDTNTTYDRAYKLARHNNYWKIVTYRTR